MQNNDHKTGYYDAWVEVSKQLAEARAKLENLEHAPALGNPRHKPRVSEEEDARQDHIQTVGELLTTLSSLAATKRRLALAEAKLLEFGQVWEDGNGYVFDPEGQP